MASTSVTGTARAEADTPGRIASAWQALGRWRRGRWVVRVAIIAALGGDAILGHVLVARGVRTAIDSMFRSAEPSLVYACARARRAGLAYQLQVSLRLVADRDADGRIDQREAARLGTYGIDEHHLDRSSAKADLSTLITAGHGAGVISRANTYQRVLHDTVTLARADANTVIGADCARVQEAVRPYRRPDYTRLATWALGAKELGYSIAKRLTRLGLASRLLTAAIIIGVAVGLGTRRQPWVSALAICVALCVACVAAQRLLWGMFWGHLAGGWWHMIGVSCKACLIGVVCAQLVWAVRIASAHMLYRARSQG